MPDTPRTCANTLEGRAPVLRDLVADHLQSIALAPLPDEIAVKDQIRAAEALARLNGWIVERKEVSGPDGGPIQHDVRALVALRDELKALREGA